MRSNEIDEIEISMYLLTTSYDMARRDRLLYTAICNEGVSHLKLNSITCI